MRLVLSVSFLTASMVPLTTYAADGVLKGRVTDKTDGEGVVGASVVIPGTTIGTATDINGNFVIKNVPAKQQKVSVSIVGYAPVTQIVNVGDGQTATLNFALGQTTIMASEVVVGAALYKQDRLDVPVTVNVVSKEKIKEVPGVTLDKVIDEVPGVILARSAGNSNATAQIRGSNTFQGGIGTRVQALYDGFPINSPETGEIVWNNINMNAADKVEVLKGSAASLYGSGAMGGVVNVFGHLPQEREIKFGVSGGFYDSPPSSDNSNYRKGYTPWFWNTYVGYGDKIGKYNFSILYSHANDDGFKVNSWVRSDDLKFKLRYDINSTQYIQLSSFISQSNGGYATLWPYSVTMDLSFLYPFPVGGVVVSGPHYTPDTTRPLDAPSSVYTDNTIARRNALFGVNYVNLLSDKLSLDTRVYFTHNDSTIKYNPTNSTESFGFYYQPMRQFTPGGPLLPFMGPQYFELDNRAPGEFNENIADRVGAGIKLDWRVAENHRLIFGVDGNLIYVKSTQYVPEWQPMNHFGLVDEKRFAAFAQDEWKISDKLTALLSARYDWDGINADTMSYKDYTLSTPILKTATILHPSVDAVSPRVALNYKATDDTSFRASWGKSFRSPTLSERFVRDAGVVARGNPNPGIDKETMIAYEAGVYKQFGEKVSVDVCGYINDYDNLIEARSLSSSNFAAPPPFQYQNVAKARIWGIEASLNFKPTSDWIFSVGYAYMNAQDKSEHPSALSGNNPDPTWLAYRPEHSGSASATWKATKKLALNVNGRYVSKFKAVSSAYAANVEGLNYPGGFIVTNVGAKYQFSKNISASLTCLNVGNVQYEEAEWFRAPGRSYVAGIDLTY